MCIGCGVNTAPSAAPRQVQGRAVNSTSVLVSWSRPPAARQNGVISQYRLQYAATHHDDQPDQGRNQTSDLLSVTVPGSQQSHVITGLDQWTQYKVWVAASTGAGEGPLSDVIVVQTDEDSMPASGTWLSSSSSSFCSKNSIADRTAYADDKARQ